jgi:hypothetical protein
VEEQESAEPEFDAIKQAATLLAVLDGSGGFSWIEVGEEAYEGAPILIAMPENAFSDEKQGCIVLAWSPSDYDYSERIATLEGGAAEMPGQAIWMGASAGLMVELRALSEQAVCWEPSKQQLGWSPDLAPTFVFPAQGSPSPNEPKETIPMPNLVGVTEKDARAWLTRNNYKFTVQPNYGLNPRLSRCIGGIGLVTGQSPRQGAQVRNDSGTFVRLEIDCEWR